MGWDSARYNAAGLPIRSRDDGMTMTTELTPGRVTTPLWRRITSLLSLISLVVIGGFVVAALLGLAAIGMLLMLDAAVG